MSAVETTKEQQISDNETTVSKAQAALSRLDKEYATLDKQEHELLALLSKTKADEDCLRQALLEASETGAERRVRGVKERDAAAVARLESALFDDSSDDDSEENDDEKDEKAANESIQAVSS